MSNDIVIWSSGAAYGLAGLVKGLGIISFKQLDIMTTLTEAIQDKKDFKLVNNLLLFFYSVL